jgi:hypothetical protein
MKKLLSLALLMSLFIACEDPDLTEDNPPLPKENVNIGVSFLYGSSGLAQDSIYTNAEGNQFFITDVKFVLSDFFVLSQGDSFKTEEVNYALYSFANSQNLVSKLPDGGYSGHYGFTLGIDSVLNWTIDPTTLASTSALTDPDVARNDGLGYNAVIIKGRAFDPTDPNDSLGSVSFEFQLGSLFLNRALKSGMTNFAVTSTTQVNFLIQVDLKDALDNYNIISRPTLLTDPSNVVDLTLAEEMMDNLKFNLF